MHVGIIINMEAREEKDIIRVEKTTKAYKPFKLIFFEMVEDDKSEARKREAYWKLGIRKERLKGMRDKIKCSN